PSRSSSRSGLRSAFLAFPSTHLQWHLHWVEQHRHLMMIAVVVDAKKDTIADPEPAGIQVHRGDRPVVGVRVVTRPVEVNYEERRPDEGWHEEEEEAPSAEHHVPEHEQERPGGEAHECA